MSSSSSTFEHKSGTSLTRVMVAQLENQNPPSLNSHPLVLAISSNLSTPSPQNTKEEKNRLYSTLSLHLSIFSVLLSLSCNLYNVILPSINKKANYEICVHNFLNFYFLLIYNMRIIINLMLEYFFLNK